ncbi:hypothetical protein G5C60_32805 [Streptomyces sp. HC44]|uniref:Uncharacterized protein n=1 Tax=Streptomyces scabichelini TaxID=2711217 RepID=A0A6G4VE60_9ACTN|nr:hypothetical protein [Streptomyces scabichelini]
MPDDVLEQFVRDSERDIRASGAPKEPSARARMVTERLRQQEARGELPPGWRTGPTWQERNGRTARRRRLWAIIGVPLALAALVVAMKPSLLPGDPFGTGSAGGTGAHTESVAPLPDETAPPTAAPTSGAPGTPTLDRPFAGSPAAQYADGAAGIVLPEATPIGSLTEAQVDKALKQTRKFLVDANLDPKTLLGGTPETALGILDPKQPRMLDDAKSWLREPGEDRDPLSLFTRFDPDEVRLVGDVVKTRGRLTFKPGDHASVAIHADYTFVYALAPAHPDSTEVTRTIVRRVIDVQLSDPTKYEATPGRLAIVRHDQESGNTACDVYDGFLHPQFASDTATGAPPSGPATDPYDRSRDIGRSEPESCGTVSRT